MKKLLILAVSVCVCSTLLAQQTNKLKWAKESSAKQVASLKGNAILDKELTPLLKWKQESPKDFVAWLKSLPQEDASIILFAVKDLENLLNTEKLKKEELSLNKASTPVDTTNIKKNNQNLVKKGKDDLLKAFPDDE
jgi:hypothetical protein